MSAEPAGEEVAVVGEAGKGGEPLRLVGLAFPHPAAGAFGKLRLVSRNSDGTQKSSGTAETLPYTLFKLQGEEGLLQYGFSALQSTHSSGVGSPRLWDICACGKAQRGCGQSSRVGWF